MRLLASLLSSAGLLVFACVVPDVELVQSFEGAGGASAGAGAMAGAGKTAGAAGHGAARAGTAGAQETEGGAPDLGAGGSRAGSAGQPGVELDDSAPSCGALSTTACHGGSCCESPL